MKGEKKPETVLPLHDQLFDLVKVGDGLLQKTNRPDARADAAVKDLISRTYRVNFAANQ